MIVTTPFAYRMLRVLDMLDAAVTCACFFSSTRLRWVLISAIGGCKRCFESTTEPTTGTADSFVGFVVELHEGVGNEAYLAGFRHIRSSMRDEPRRDELTPKTAGSRACVDRKACDVGAT